jgi:hypothetical protein
MNNTIFCVAGSGLSTEWVESAASPGLWQKATPFDPIVECSTESRFIVQEKTTGENVHALYLVVIYENNEMSTLLLNKPSLIEAVALGILYNLTSKNKCYE